MGKDIDLWPEIAALIDRDKATALEEFRKREFAPVPMPAPHAVPMPGLRPWLSAVAASLIVAAALASFWVLKRSWHSTPGGPLPASGLLDGTFLYTKSGNPALVDMTHSGPRPSSPLFTAWAEAGLGRTSAEAEPVDPLAPVERGDPEQVRRKMSRVIREHALEQLLTRFREIQDKET